jgi:transposase
VQAAQKLGRSRGGLSSKLHLLCEGRCRPLSLALSAGQVHDSDEATIGAVLDGVRVPRPGGKGRPRKRPERVLGDKGYNYKKCRRLLRQRGIASMIPERKDQREQRKNKGKAGGRPCHFDKAQYRRRNTVERTFLRLKQQRRVATRYDKLGASYQAWATLASIRLWLK